LVVSLGVKFAVTSEEPTERNEIWSPLIDATAGVPEE
jgi:hypothetical protein